MTDYEALEWLCLHDPEARVFWISMYLCGYNLVQDVNQNLYDFGELEEL